MRTGYALLLQLSPARDDVDVMISRKGRAALADWLWRRRMRAWRRAEFKASAEAVSLRSIGRPLTPEELARVFRRYPANR